MPQDRQGARKFQVCDQSCVDGWPYPPPPGVSRRRRCPGASSPAHFGGSSSPSRRLRPTRAVLTTLAPARGVQPALGDQGESHRLERLDLAHDPVAAALSARSARPATQRDLTHPHRVLGLERLDRGVERVRHRHMDRARPVGVGAGALATAGRLVVGEAVAGQGEVVHRALALRGGRRATGKSREDEVGNATRRLDVARGHGGRRLRVEQAALRCANLDRPVRAGRRRRVRIGQHPHDVEGGRLGDGERAVEVAAHLVRRSREVEDQLVAGHGRAHPQLDLLTSVSPALEDVARLVRAVVELCDRGPGAPLGVVEDLRHPRAESVGAQALDQLLDPCGAGAVGGALGA